MTITINGVESEATGSILDAVLATGTEIPHLCKDDNLAAIGACRTCLVEADGRIVASCSLPADSAKMVETHTERAVALRRGVLELTSSMQAAAGPDTSGGPCGATAAANYLDGDVDAGRFTLETATAVDTSGEFFSFHEDQCILCGRCVAACQDLQHIGAIGMAGGGRETRVTPGTDLTFRASICTACGSCVAACPTLALRPTFGGT